MLSASANFKNYIQQNGREIALRISWDAIVLQSADIKSCVKWFDGELYTSVMQGIELEVEGVYDMKGKSLLVEFGVSYNGSAIEWLTWGTFLVKNHWNLAESKSTKIEAFDAMLKSHIAYDLTPTYPITVGNYLQAICTRLGITLATPTFTNSTVSIPDEKYAMLDNIIFRDVLDELAEVVGGIIHIRANGDLAVKYPTATSQSLNSNVKTVDVEKLFGEVNTLVLATTPAEDNTLREDLTSIATYGRHEVRFEDNQIMVLTPDSYIDNLFNQIKFTKYYPFELDSFGYGYFEVGDIINVVDENDVSYQTIVLGGSITIDGGFTEMMYAKVPDMATTPDYDNAHRTLSPRETAIILNRQARKIELQAAEIDLKVNADGVIASINLTPELIKILASKIQLEGVVTANTYFKINLDGSMETTAGKIGRFDISGDDLVYTSDLFNRDYDKSDYVKLSRILAGLDTPTAYESEVYDVNNTGTLTITDLVMINLYVTNGDPLPTPRRQIRSVIRIGTTSGEIKTTAVSALGNTGPTFVMKADKLTGDLLNVKTFGAKGGNIDLLDVINGVRFPSTFVGSTDSYTLDDYREVSFTPIVSGGTTVGTGTYSVQEGRYVKIGKVVYFSIRLTWSAHTGTGAILVGNFPIPTANITALLHCYNVRLSAYTIPTGTFIQAFSQPNTQIIQFESYSGSTGTALALDTNASLSISGSYLAEN